MTEPDALPAQPASPDWFFEQFCSDIEYLGGLVIEPLDQTETVVVSLSPMLAKLLKRPHRLTYATWEAIPQHFMLEISDRRYHAEHGHPRPKPAAAPASCRRCLSNGLDTLATTEYLGAPVCARCRLWIMLNVNAVPAPAPVVIGNCSHCYSEMTERSKGALRQQLEAFGKSLGLCWKCWSNHAIRLDMAGNQI